VPQNFKPAMGPVASTTAITQLSAMGAGFFGSNAMHPFANPSPLSNFFEMLAIVLLPISLCYTFGKMTQDPRQGRTLLLTMWILFLPCAGGILYSEITHLPDSLSGTETRVGIISSALWSALTTATSNGSTNAFIESMTPLTHTLQLWLMHLGEVALGGVGSGIYGMLMFVMMAVFIAGLMVGRSPEYLGKKLEPYEMKMACIAVLVMPVLTLLPTAMALMLSYQKTDPHHLTEILYAFSSMSNNNGSALSQLNTNTPFYNILGGLVMFMGRYGVILPILAIAGSLAHKKIMATTIGTLETHSLLFILLLTATIILFGALSFLPALVLGPIVKIFL
jgi:K+-transporting ATPase ATPase A chain